MPIKQGQLFIILAVIMGIITMVMMANMMGNKNDQANKPAATVQKEEVVTQTVVASADTIYKGQTITMDNLRAVEWPASFLPTGATFDKPSQVVGRVALQDILPGEPIYAQKLVSGDTAGMPALIPAGYRAITVAVTEISGVAGFVKPGDHVDIIGAFEVKGTSSDGKDLRRKRSVAVLQNVLVLASAQTLVRERGYDIDTPEGVLEGKASTKVSEPAKTATGADATKPKSTDDLEKERKAKQEETQKRKNEEKMKQEDTERKAKLVQSVTVAVSPVDAQKLFLADDMGELRLVLRPASDTKVVPVRAVRDEEVIYSTNGAEGAPHGKMPVMPKVPAMVRPTGPSVEVIEGTNKTSVQF